MPTTSIRSSLSTATYGHRSRLAARRNARQWHGRVSDWHAIFTIVGSRFDLPQVTTHTAEQAYIQVLSRAGANRFRDAIDKRITRSVLNNLPGQILTQNDWGGYPTIPGGTAPPDSNSDGVPDQWAIDHGFNPATPLHQSFAPDGYTYLEKYIHSLTPNAYAPVGTVRTPCGPVSATARMHLSPKTAEPARPAAAMARATRSTPRSAAI